MDQELPIIQQISWITSDAFDPEKVIIGDPVKTGGEYFRSNILYMYENSQESRNLCITTLRDPESYMTCNKVEREMFGNVETNHTNASFVFNGKNSNHVAFYTFFGKILEKIKQLSGISDISLPFADYDEKSILYARLIESNNRIVYTAAYDDTKQVDIRELRQVLARPAFIFTLTYKDKTQAKLRVQLAQMYVNKYFNVFPLANQN